MVNAAALQGQRVQGWVRKFQGNWGFLNSDYFEGDCFVGLKQNPHLGNLNPEDKVEFTIDVNRGKAEAADVALLGPGAGRVVGRVRSFRGTWGFINSDAVEGDLFVGLKNNPGLAGLQEGDHVEFEVAIDDKGKKEAVNVVTSTGVAPARSRIPAASPVVTNSQGGKCDAAGVGHLLGQVLAGRIKSFRDKWGFIVSDSFPGDLFVHLRSNPSLGNAQVNDAVQFRIEQDDKEAGGFKAVDAALSQAEPLDLVGHKVQGWVKSFRDSWGLLNSDRFEGDVFCGLKHNQHLAGQPLQTGDPVQFQIAADPKSQRGVEAVLVQRLAAAPMMARPIVSTAPRVQPMMYAQSPAVAVARQAVNGDLAGIQGRQCTGQIRSFRGTWGFVVSNMFAGDLFVGTKNNPELPPDLKEGDQIQFTVQATPGKSQAGFEAVNARLAFGRALPAMGRPGRKRSRSPRRAGGGSADPSQFLGQVLTGWIRSFKGTWGFINSDHFEGDLFMGTKNNPAIPASIAAETQVQFEVTQGPSGKLEAINVAVL